MNSLLERIGELKKADKNFAYICHFTDEERRMGDETLFVGSQILRSNDASILDTFTDKIPVILSFSLVNSIFTARVKESEFSPVMALVPEEVVEGKYVRSEHFNRSPMIQYREDSGMEAMILIARERIRNGEMLQVVLSKQFGPIHADPETFMRRYLEEDRSKYVFYYKFGELELFGSTPENLVSVSGLDVMIEPIAGTRRVSVNPEENRYLAEELLSDPKELLEHRMLVDLARNDLGKISQYGSVNVHMSMEVRQFASVMHIVSRVKGKLKEGTSRSQIVNAVFPAGTVSGAPKDRALRTIAELEQNARGPYAGAIGIIDSNAMELALTIRSMYGKKGAYYVRSGAGIVKDSVPATEVREISMKAYNAAGGALDDIAYN